MMSFIVSHIRTIFSPKEPSSLPQAKAGSSPLDETNLKNKDLFCHIFHEIESTCRPDPQIIDSPQHDQIKDVKRKKQVLLEISDRVVKSVVCDILGKRGALAHAKDDIIGHETWEDLNLFSKTGSEHTSLSERVDRTSTELGKMYLKGLIGSPTTDCECLRSRQALIRGLIHTGLVQQISKSFASKEAQEGERQLLSLWNGRMGYPERILKRFFSPKRLMSTQLNQTPSALDGNSLYTDGKNIKKVLYTAFKTALLASLVIAQFKVGAGVDLSPKLMKMILPKVISGKLLKKFLPKILASGVGFALALEKIREYYEKIKHDVLMLNVNRILDSALHKKFFAIASYYRKMKEIYEMLLKHPELTSHLNHFQDLKDFFEDQELSPIFQVLGSKTFDSEAKFIFRKGNILFLMNQFMKPEVREKFEPALSAIAEIDAFTSTAKLVEERKAKRVRFCFPNYREGKKTPELHLDHFWNPLLDPEKVVANSVHFASSSPIRSHIITGRNGGGKTTVLRSIGEAIVLGQTLGIAPADKALLSPFTYVASSMHIKDSHGESSTYQAECDRAASIQKRLDALRPTEFSYVALDELFKGTDAGHAEALSYSFVESLGARRNVLSSTVTHRMYLTKLEKPKSAFKNYRITAHARLTLGTSKHRHEPFKVALQRGFTKQQIQKALAVYKNAAI